MSVSRRQFLETAAWSSVAFAALGAEVDSRTGMPTRLLGKTNARVSILAFGSGSRFLAYEDEDQALGALNKALDMGITYVDTAYAYGNGKSETRVGKVMAQRRKQVFLATKVSVREGDEAMRSIEGSLKRLQTDHVDLLHIHNLTTPEDLAAIEKKGNVLDQLIKAKEQKMARFIGITCHTNPVVLKAALERHDFDCTQMALNAARQGMATLPPDAPAGTTFETTALPVAVRKKMGIIAMKLFLQDKLVGKASAEALVRYSMSLPVSAAVAGMPKIEHIEENIAIAKRFKPLPASEMKVLAQRMEEAYMAMAYPAEYDHADV